LLLLDIGERIGAVFLTVQENNAMLDSRQAETNIIEWLGLLVFNVGNYPFSCFLHGLLACSLPFFTLWSL